MSLAWAQYVCAPTPSWTRLRRLCVALFLVSAVSFSIPIPMKTLLFLMLAFTANIVSAADNLATFRAGLQAYQANGPDALLASWYNPGADADKIAKAREQLLAITRNLGAVVETEVFAPKNLGSKIQRIYGVIYFEQRPLWLRAEFYTIGGRSGILSLEFSTHSEDILPLEFAPPARS